MLLFPPATPLFEVIQHAFVMISRLLTTLVSSTTSHIPSSTRADPLERVDGPFVLGGQFERGGPLRRVSGHLGLQLSVLLHQTALVPVGALQRAVQFPVLCLELLQGGVSRQLLQHLTDTDTG